MSLPNPVQEASEIVAGIAAMDPHDVIDKCAFCRGDDNDGPLTHDPDCLWIRARRLTRQPVAPHRVVGR